MISTKLKYIKDIDNMSYYSFIPKLGKWYYEDYSGYTKHSLSHCIRMLIEYLEGGYKIFYLAVSGEIVGYVTVARGGRRLRCSNSEDIVLGPIWVNPKSRGNGIASKGIYAVLHELGIVYENAYEYIKPDNIPSIRTVEKNGFSLIGSGSSKGPLKRIYNDGSKEFLIYRFSSGRKEE